MVTEGACPLIIGQWGTQCSADAMFHQHEASAETGIASITITSPAATSLNRDVMLLKDTTAVAPALAVTEVTAACRSGRGAALPDESGCPDRNRCVL